MTSFQLIHPDFTLSEFNVDVCETPYEEEEIPSPPPLLRMDCLSRYSPPFEEQMTRIYKLIPGKVYTFKQYYALHSREIEDHPLEITGTFSEFHNFKVFWFIVDGELLEVNYRNFSYWHLEDVVKKSQSSFQQIPDIENNLISCSDPPSIQEP